MATPDEWTRRVDQARVERCGDGVSPQGERGISPRGDARHDPRDYVFRIALIHIRQCAHMPRILAEARCWAGWVWVGGIRCGRALDADTRVSKCRLFLICDPLVYACRRVS